MNERFAMNLKRRYGVEMFLVCFGRQLRKTRPARQYVLYGTLPWVRKSPHLDPEVSSGGTGRKRLLSIEACTS